MTLYIYGYNQTIRVSKSLKEVGTYLCDFAVFNSNKGLRLVSTVSIEMMQMTYRLIQYHIMSYIETNAQPRLQAATEIDLNAGSTVYELLALYDTPVQEAVGVSSG